MVGNDELAKKLFELLKRYGLPAETKIFTIQVEPHLVTVDCNFYPSRLRKRAAPAARTARRATLARVIEDYEAGMTAIALAAGRRALQRVADGR